MDQMDDRQAVLEAIRSGDRFVVVSHENPDGDALGSLVAAHAGLTQLGKDSIMYLGGEVPLPHEYRFMELSAVRRGPAPPEAAGRVVLAVDCASARRIGPDGTLLEQASLVLDVDHHQDNTRFGGINLIIPDASSTGEIVHDLLVDLGVTITPEIAEALYIAIVTDTGRFQYTNTTSRALRLAADLKDAGADTQKIFAGVYESMSLAKLRLLARALDSVRVYEDGKLIVCFLAKQDFADAGAAEPFAEGIIDTIRAVEGAEMVALIREPPTPGGPTRRVSVRTRSERIDASRVAGAAGGGGHRRAAGFSSEDSADEIAAFVHEQYLTQAGGG